MFFYVNIFISTEGGIAKKLLHFKIKFVCYLQPVDYLDMAKLSTYFSQQFHKNPLCNGTVSENNSDNKNNYFLMLLLLIILISFLLQDNAILLRLESLKY